MDPDTFLLVVSPDGIDTLEILLTNEIEEIAPFVLNGIMRQDYDLIELAADARYLGRLGRMLAQLRAAQERIL
jgi:hypothetical protein